MGIFNVFPRTNFHELNLDWIINKIKGIENGGEELEKKVKENSDKIVNSNQRITQNENKIINITESIGNMNNTINNLTNEIENNKTKINENSNDINNLELITQSHTQSISNINDSIAQFLIRFTNIENDIEGNTNEINNNKNEITSLKNELKTVEKSSIVYDFFDLTNRITLGDIGSKEYTIRYFTVCIMRGFNTAYVTINSSIQIDGENTSAICLDGDYRFLYKLLESENIQLRVKTPTNVVSEYILGYIPCEESETANNAYFFIKGFPQASEPFYPREIIRFYNYAPNSGFTYNSNITIPCDVIYLTN